MKTKKIWKKLKTTIVLNAILNSSEIGHQRRTIYRIPIIYFFYIVFEK